MVHVSDGERRRKAGRRAQTPGQSSEQVDEVDIKVPPTFARRRPAVDASSDTMIIGEILERKSTCPATFKLKARIVDYEPKDLSKTIVWACIECGVTYVTHIPDLGLMCLHRYSAGNDDPECQECGAGAESLQYHFDLAFSLVDASQPSDNTTLDVVASKDVRDASFDCP